jgi:hypothetical protein
MALPMGYSGRYLDYLNQYALMHAKFTGKFSPDGNSFSGGQTQGLIK